MSRPTIMFGDSGSFVEEVQTCLEIPVDGDFGKQTQRAVQTFQTAQRLESDGIVGEQTWAAFERVYNLPAYPPPLPTLDPQLIEDILRMVEPSQIAQYKWKDRGVAPRGYMEGMAITFAMTVLQHIEGDSSALEMAKADTRNDDLDALSWYSDRFDELGMSNESDGIDTLRHLFVLLLGLGMRESSGVFCCGRDQSASNTDAMTCEAGLFQMSWNASSCSQEMQKLFDQFEQLMPCEQCALGIFSQDGAIDCTAANWECYGSGPGLAYQELAKDCPAFAVQTTAIGLRNLRKHWGPIVRYEAEVRPEADDLFKAVQLMIASTLTS